MSTIVTSEAIRKKEIFGNFIKFTYYTKSSKSPTPIENSVYCYNESDFIKLLKNWNDQAKRLHADYFYYYKGDSNTINLEDIPVDNNFKLKVMLTDTYNKVTYIS
jgi:hypothetical protein